MIIFEIHPNQEEGLSLIDHAFKTAQEDWRACHFANCIH